MRDYSNPDQLLSRLETARLLSVSPKTLLRMERAGEIQRVQISRRPKYRLGDILDLIERKRRSLMAA